MVLCGIGYISLGFNTSCHWVTVSSEKKRTIGIDAANLRGGGGITHLVELLRAAQPELLGIDRIVLWGGEATLNAVDDRPWLEKRNPPALNKGLLHRTIWQRFALSNAVREAGCDVLFVPGGSYAGNFHPVVTMSRNMLPFEFAELKRYGWSLFTFKMLILRITQSHSYGIVTGLIFLTEYARESILSKTGKLHGKICTIPHGLNSRFVQEPKLQRSISNYDKANPYRILYVSIIDLYKHQWHVVEAIEALRKQGLPLVLDLVGPAYPPALKLLKKTIDRIEGSSMWVNYYGAIPFDELHLRYKQADMGLFASSCENMPNILLETMASGLPIACSRRGPMPEILGSAGSYFDPECPKDIARAIETLIQSPQLRGKLAQLGYEKSMQYSWQRCANETFQFLIAVT